MRTIKRYSNRRLYDTLTSRTITQFDLARLIREGHQVRVIDSVTDEDITLSILGRVLAGEAEHWGTVAEARELIRAIIYTGGEKSMSILRNTILASIGALHVTRDKAEKIIDELIKKGDLDKSDRKKAVMELLAKAEKSTAGWRKKILAEAEKAQKGVKDLTSGMARASQDDFKKLERKVSKLVKQVKDLQEKID